MLKIINRLSEKQLLIYLLIIGFITRLLFLSTYFGVTISGDSTDYIRLAQTITDLDITQYKGRRTPGYSILIAVLQNKLIYVVVLQLLLGLLNLYLLYKFVKLLSNKIVAFSTTIFYNLFTHILFYETAILTESLTTTLIVVSVWFMVKFKLFDVKTSFKKYVFFAILLSFIYLTKPMFIYIPLGFLLFYILKNWKNKKQLTKPLTTFIICFFVYIGWNQFNKSQIGYFTNTQYFGINLAQTATPFFEKTPDKDSKIRNLIVKHRDSVLKIKSNLDADAMVVWFAYKDLKRETNLSDLELSNKLGSISKKLIKKHPKEYIKQVGKSWLLFWGKPHLYLNKTNFTQKSFSYIHRLLWFNFLGYIVVLFNILFLFSFTRTLFTFIKNKSILFSYTFFISSIVIVGSIAQALVAYGNNSRFCVPFLPLIIYVVISNIFKFTTSKTKT
ncbi:glycosyltransferase family 39 protein [Aurantibacter sp.]|uniref:glycosyltransferase family 39 protein n=1 Tax=Aurantibacter sp. TaxID=2807103 RepID=UPI0035C872B3